MPEITELLSVKRTGGQHFIVDTTPGTLYVTISDEASTSNECDNTDTKSTFLVGDNIFIVGAGINIPESFALSTPNEGTGGAKLPKINIYLYPDAPGYDPTPGLPASPSTGNIWIATATANGWTNNHIYRYNGSAWEDITSGDGAIYHHRLYPVIANTTGSFYIPFENFEYLLNVFIDIVNGTFYDWSDSVYVTGFKLPFEMFLSIDHNTLRVSMVNVPVVLDTITHSIVPFVKITHNFALIHLADFNS